MARPLHLVTDLSSEASLEMLVDGTVYPITQVNLSWALNSIPTAVCMLAVGRNARTGVRAAVHLNKAHRRASRVLIRFQPAGEYAHGVPWPGGTETLFDGMLNGFSDRKMGGKVHVVASLVHRLAYLTMSSAVSADGHPANASSLNAAAVIQSFDKAGAARGHYVAGMRAMETIAGKVGSDMASALKSVFEAFAGVRSLSAGACGGTGDIGDNAAALAGLSLIEGPGLGKTDLPYSWGVPLAIDAAGIASVSNSVADSIGNELVTGYANVTMWDKLVGQFCPTYGMALVPRADSALLIADTPALRGSHWREIDLDEYEGADYAYDLQPPLRAVGVLSGLASPTGAGEGLVDPSASDLGGCYASAAAAGVVRYVGPPPWLVGLRFLSDYAAYNTGLAGGRGGKTSTTPGTPPAGPTPPRDAFGLAVNDLFARYAQNVYALSCLQGRTGTVTTKLRFDVAPGSLVKLVPSAETFSDPGDDELALTLYGCVSRVNITISPESGAAGTVFTLSHVRTEEENGSDDFTVASHPLFGGAVHGGGRHGCPLVDAYAFD